MFDGMGTLQAEKAVDRFNQEKLYIQVARILIDEIINGHWRLNDRIPSEDELCKSYQVSKTTVRQAISNLVADGYLMKIQGKGTFVTSDQPMVGFTMKTRPTEERFGKEVHSERTIISRGEMDPTPEVKAYLRTEDRILYLNTCSSVEGETIYVQESFIPLTVLPEIDDRTIAERPLFEVLQQYGRKKIFKVVQTIEIGKASRETARDLELAEGLPVLVVHRLFVSSDNTPIAYTRLQGRSDRYKFQTEFERLR